MEDGIRFTRHSIEAAPELVSELKIWAAQVVSREELIFTFGVPLPLDPPSIDKLLNLDGTTRSFHATDIVLSPHGRKLCGIATEVDRTDRDARCRFLLVIETFYDYRKSASEPEEEITVPAYEITLILAPAADFDGLPEVEGIFLRSLDMFYVESAYE